jgi:pyrroloquinoline quinone biosynthesis protein D
MTNRERLVLTSACCPQLARHAKLRFDDTRKRWILLAPERLLTLSETAVAMLNLCDGARSIDGIATKLAAEFNASAAAILDDILPMLQDLTDKGYITA